MIEIRKAELDDAAAIARVHVLVWRSAYRGLMPDDFLAGISLEDRTELWTNTIPLESHSTYVAEAGNEIVGFALSGSDREDESGSTGELYAIYVLESFAGTGIGSKLIAAAEAWMTARGYKEAILWVLSANSSSRSFYERRGWFEDGFERSDEVLGAEVFEARYRKRLAGT